MKHFIGYLIQGKAATWHTETAKDISRKFGTWEIHKKFPPHVTIFPPFDTEDIKKVTGVIRAWMTSNDPKGQLKISDFGRFDDRVIFASVEADQVVQESVTRLQNDLQNIPGMPQAKLAEWHPHATLANHISAEEIKNVWEYVQRLPKPQFAIPFNNVTLFRLTDNRTWEAYMIFDI